MFCIDCMFERFDGFQGDVCVCVCVCVWGLPARLKQRSRLRMIQNQTRQGWFLVGDHVTPVVTCLCTSQIAASQLQCISRGVRLDSKNAGNGATGLAADCHPGEHATARQELPSSCAGPLPSDGGPLAQPWSLFPAHVVINEVSMLRRRTGIGSCNENAGLQKIHWLPRCESLLVSSLVSK